MIAPRLLNTEALLDRLAQGEEVAVPSHWLREVSNGLMQGKKKGRVTEPEIQRFLADLSSFRIVIDADNSFSRLALIRDIAEHRQLTSYDAAYPELAERMSLPVATLDSALHLAAQAEGIVLI
jgi:predicted nucleic acid-binding protein